MNHVSHVPFQPGTEASLMNQAKNTPFVLGGKSGSGMGDMKGMQGMSGDMGAHHQMMAKRMEMMDMMMNMMGDQMSAAPAR